MIYFLVKVKTGLRYLALLLVAGLVRVWGLLKKVPLSAMFASFIRLAGYDSYAYKALSVKARMALFVLALLSIASAMLGGWSIGYGAILSGLSIAISFVFTVLLFLFFLNIVRLLNGGSGYPVSLDISNLTRWRPALLTSLCLTFIGILVTSPFVWYLTVKFNPALSETQGLVGSYQAMFSDYSTTVKIALTTGFFFSAFEWCRFLCLTSVRAYEKAKWENIRHLIEYLHPLQDSTIEALIEKEKEKEKARREAEEEKIALSLSGIWSDPEESSDEAGSPLTKVESKEQQQRALPEYFKLSNRELLFNEYYNQLKQALAEFLGVHVINVEQKLLSSFADQKVSDIFNFEIENSTVFKQMARRPLMTVPLPVLKPSLLECADCWSALKGLSTQAGYVFSCSLCHGALYSERQLVSIFGAQVSHQYWHNQPYVQPVKESKKAQLGNKLFKQYSIREAKNSKGKHFASVANILYCKQDASYWFPSGQLDALLTLLRGHQLANLERDNIEDETLAKPSFTQ